VWHGRAAYVDVRRFSSLGAVGACFNNRKGISHAARMCGWMTFLRKLIMLETTAVPLLRKGPGKRYDDKD